MRGGRGLRIATAGVRTGFAMTLTISEAPPHKKPRRVCRPQAAKIEIIFHRDMRVGKNTSQAASVEFWRSAPKLCAEQTASLLSEKSGGFFDSIKKRLSRRTAFLKLGEITPRWR